MLMSLAKYRRREKKKMERDKGKEDLVSGVGFAFYLHSRLEESSQKNIGKLVRISCIQKAKI